LPYIATTAGWMTAELGRQPWLIFKLYRTSQGVSDVVSGGNVLFTLIGFCGLYFVLGVLYLFLIGREVAEGPQRTRQAPLFVQPQREIANASEDLSLVGKSGGVV